MVFSSAAENDERDGNSCYASTTSQTEKGTVFLFDVEDDGLLLQVVSARASMPAGLGMCATILRLTSALALEPLARQRLRPAGMPWHSPTMFFYGTEPFHLQRSRSMHLLYLQINKCKAFATWDQCPDTCAVTRIMMNCTSGPHEN